MSNTGKLPPGATQAPLPKRFYETVSVERSPPAQGGADHGFRVLLDGRPIRTPAKLVLSVPTAELAEMLAQEWRAQAEVIDPATMPITRLVNTVLDGVTGRETDVRAAIARYASSDLLCYHADAPAELAARQQAGWCGILDWLADALGVRLLICTGVMPLSQDPGMLARVEALLQSYGAFELAAMHEITTLTGSVVLALACAHGRLTPEEAWTLAHIDEDFQIEQWGRDQEEAVRRERRCCSMAAAGRLLAACGRPAAASLH